MIDLHLHSNHSDGTLTPAELVRMAAQKNLRAISITDHDTISGTEEALEEGKACNVTVISGVELSVVHGDVFFHLLGYGFDHEDQKLIVGLQRLQDSRSRRNLKILAKLKEIGIDISIEELLFESGGGQTGRPHIASLLIKKGVTKTMDQAFERYLKKDGKAYVSRFIYSAGKAIELIHAAGGITSLAHPVQFGYTLNGLPELLEDLKAVGLDGVETYYPTQKGRYRKKLSELAVQLDMLQTGGSDYHGSIRPGTAMAGGVKFEVPEALFHGLKKHLV